MTIVFNWIDHLSWSLLILGSLTLGLAPFFPEPHLIEKLRMLSNGELKAPLDWFDLFLHGTIPLLLLIKLIGTGIKQL
ncbi:hypothetical protein [Oceanospirillum maris]|jgi:hypothetical protein|uniref:hypothetical protein n=1 Tax=Oceanospirillum maris TaxID=64977 RepID=UPI0004012E27|nr:hypothetical protein [Oceanospirillum maris]